MLIERNIQNKQQSIYSCDRCKVELNWQNKVAVYIGLPSRSPRKRWDLCKKCYSSLVRGIEK